MNQTIKYFDLVWPDTGRRIPLNVEVEIRKVHPKWKDLCWKRERNGITEWVYVSTLPNA